MKNTIKLLGITALVAVIGFSMAACGGDDPGDGGGNGGGDGPTFLGATPTLSGQVYVQKYDENKGTVSFQAYTGGNQTVYATNGFSDTIGQGTIKGGQLSITLRTPTSLDNIKSIFYGWSDSGGSGGGVSVDDYGADDLTVSPSTAKGVHLDFVVGSSFLGEGGLGRINFTGVYTNGTYEGVEYFYVDKDCTISSTGKTETDPYEEDYISITKPFSLALQAGWNTVYFKSQSSASGGKRTTTITYSMGNPGNLKWVLYEEDEGSSSGGSGSYEEP